MGKIFKILKINLLSLVGLILFLLSAVLGIIGGIYKKILYVLILPIAIFITLVIGWICIQPDWAHRLNVFLAVLLTAFLLFFIFGLITTFAVDFLTSLYAGILIGIYESYSFCYINFINLFSICKADFKIINDNNHIIHNFTCLFFSILKIIHRIISKILSLGILASVFICFAYLSLIFKIADKSSQKDFETGIISFLKSGDTENAVAYAIVFGILVLGGIGIIISIGKELRELGKEFMNNINWDTTQNIGYENILEDIPDYILDNDSKENEYYNLLVEHLNQYNEFMEAALEFICIVDNSALNVLCNQYSDLLERLVKEIFKGDTILELKMIRKHMIDVKQLDMLKKNISAQIEKLKEKIKNPIKSTLFFNGCDTKEKLNKRYKSLCKVYHPDIESGDEEIFKQIQEEYEKLKIMEFA